MAHEQMGVMIATLFLARDMAHRAHLKVAGEGSYAAHKALNEFYDSIVDLADGLTEAYQGRFEALLNIPLLAAPDEPDIRTALRAQWEWIRDNRYDAIPKEETPLHNMVDEIEAAYFEVNYKLKFLE